MHLLTNTGSSAADTAAQYLLRLSVTSALRGQGTILVGPYRLDDLTAGASVIAPPGVLLRTPASNEAPYSSAGWRVATWLARPDGTVPRIDEVRPDKHRDVDLAEVVEWGRERERVRGDVDVDSWTHAAFERAISTWLGILRPGGGASSKLKGEALRRIDESFMDAAHVWGETWVQERTTPAVWDALAAARCDLNGDEEADLAHVTLAGTAQGY